MRTLTTIAELRHALGPARAGSTIGLVPTMGALHAGHVALIEAARSECDLVVASIFVNPAQFQEQSDLDAYPADLSADLARAEEAGVDLVFAPTLEEFYPSGFATWVDPEGAAAGLEGEARPGHFRGVATACLKLFTIAAPDIAYFGRKDAQQVAVVKQLVRDLNLELEIRVVATIRDGTGSRCRRGTPVCRPRSGAGRSRSRVPWQPATPAAPAACSTRPASSPTTSRWPTSTGRRSPSRHASVRPA